MYGSWLYVCLCVDYARKTYPIDLQFWTYVERAKFRIKFEDEKQNVSKNK